MSLPYHICLLPSAHLEKTHDVGIFPAVRYDTTVGFDLVSKKYRTAAGITDRISADDLILIVTVHRIKVSADTAEVLLLTSLFSSGTLLFICIASNLFSGICNRKGPGNKSRGLFRIIIYA